LSPVSDALFRLSPAVRYVAVYRHGVLTMAERPNVHVPSSVESDRYEELLVNPGRHVSISIESEADALALVPQVRRVLVAAGLFPA
jgi:hypothetical protein